MKDRRITRHAGFALLALTLFVASTAQAQELPVPEAGAPAVAGVAAEERLLLAISSEEYPVTPGDVYRLTYLQAGQIITNEILVESDYSLNLNLFGKLNVAGDTFATLKPRVERIVSDAYPRGMPLLTITSVGIYQVLIKGEVPQTTYVTAWGLSRLSDVLEGVLGPYSSVREVGVMSRQGDFVRYDLFRAQRQGITDQNPIVRPGDVIVIYRRNREIQITGEIHRPGRYQLLSGEGMREAVELYGGQLTELAAVDRVRIDRIAGAQGARTLYADLSSGYAQMPELQDGDIITVPAKTRTLPFVFFEGAVVPLQPAAVVPGAPEEGQEIALPAYGRITHPFRPGEVLSDAVRLVWESISPAAALADSYVIREGEAAPIAVDLERLLGASGTEGDLLLQPYDRIVIPARQFFVSVSGTVENPGSYPYVPNKTYAYYLLLSGGVDAEGAQQSIVVTDSQGNRRDIEAVIQPEDRIYVAPALVTVSGAVFGPGSFPYGPERTALHYINLAGGIDPERNTNGRITVTDAQSRTRDSDEVIGPGDRIFVHSNSFLYNFNTYFPIITTAITFITTIIGIVNLLLQ